MNEVIQRRKIQVDYHRAMLIYQTEDVLTKMELICRMVWLAQEEMGELFRKAN